MDVYEDDSLLSFNFGATRWLCLDCNTKLLNKGNSRFLQCPGKDTGGKIEDQSVSLTSAQRDAMLVKLNTESDNMKSMLASILEILQKAPDKYSPVFESPVRKKLKVIFPDDDLNPAFQFYNSSGNTVGLSDTYSEKVKMNIKKIAADENTNLLKSLYDAKSLIPGFTGKKKMDGSVDVLFKNFDDANKADYSR